MADDQHGAGVALEPGLPARPGRPGPGGWWVRPAAAGRTGHISARASCRRMRQPPEKLLTGWSSSLILKPRPRISAWARAVASCAPASCQVGMWPGQWPCRRRPVRRAAGARCSFHQAGVAVKTNWVAESSVSGMCWATWPCAMRGDEEVAAVFVQRAVEQGKQRGLACAVAADQTHVLTGVDGGVDAVEHHFGAAAQGDVFQGRSAARKKAHPQTGRIVRGVEENESRLAQAR